jgi:hypothetical protein
MIAPPLALPSSRIFIQLDTGGAAPPPELLLPLHLYLQAVDRSSTY